MPKFGFNAFSRLCTELKKYLEGKVSDKLNYPVLYTPVSEHMTQRQWDQFYFSPLL